MGGGKATDMTALVFAVSGSAFGASAQGSPRGVATARGRDPAPALVRAEGSGQVSGPNDLGLEVASGPSHAELALLFSRSAPPYAPHQQRGGWCRAGSWCKVGS